MRFSLLLVLALVACSCALVKDGADSAIVCSDKWFWAVEEKVRITDSQGHGPDPGSMEWRSAVEFKLGIRGKPVVPPIESAEWCTYINEHYIGA